MFSFLFKRLSGRHYRKFLEKSRPIVARINELEQSYQSLTDEQLRAKTEEFKGRVQGGETLDQLLPEAFAAVKSAARRLVGRKALVVATNTVTVVALGHTFGARTHPRTVTVVHGDRGRDSRARSQPACKTAVGTQSAHHRVARPPPGRGIKARLMQP